MNENETQEKKGLTDSDLELLREREFNLDLISEKTLTELYNKIDFSLSDDELSEIERKIRDKYNTEQFTAFNNIKKRTLLDNSELEQIKRLRNLLKILWNLTDNQTFKFYKYVNPKTNQLRFSLVVFNYINHKDYYFSDNKKEYTHSESYKNKSYIAMETIFTNMINEYQAKYKQPLTKIFNDESVRELIIKTNMFKAQYKNNKRY